MREGILYGSRLTMLSATHPAVHKLYQTYLVRILIHLALTKPAVTILRMSLVDATETHDEQ